MRTRPFSHFPALWLVALALLPLLTSLSVPSRTHQQKVGLKLALANVGIGLGGLGVGTGGEFPGDGSGRRGVSTPGGGGEVSRHPGTVAGGGHAATQPA